MVEPPKAHRPFGFACSVVLRTSCGESVSREKAKGKGSAAQPYARHASSVLPENAGATHSPCGWTERCQSITKNRASQCRLHGLPFTVRLLLYVGRPAAFTLPLPVTARESAGLPRGYCVTRMHGTTAGY